MGGRVASMGGRVACMGLYGMHRARRTHKSALGGDSRWAPRIGLHQALGCWVVEPTINKLSLSYELHFDGGAPTGLFDTKYYVGVAQIVCDFCTDLYLECQA